MELLYLISLLLLPISLLLLFFSLGQQKDNKNLPPGRTGWPFIGESLEYFSWGRKGSPDMFFSQRTSRYSSEIFKTCLFGEHLTVMCGPEANKFLFTTESRRVAAWWPYSVGKIFPALFAEMDSYNEESLRRRTMMARFVKPESLKKYVEIMDTLAIIHMQIIKRGATVTVYSLAKRYTFEVACKVFLSIEDPQHIDKIYKPFGVLVAGMISIPIDLPGFPLNRAIKATKIIRKEMGEIIKQRKILLSSSSTSAAGKNDILFHMLTTTDEIGRFMEESEIVDIILGLLFVGFDTASIAITSIINYMAELPQVYDQVYQEQMKIVRSKQVGEMLSWEDLQKMSYSWSVVSEALRMAPPAQISFRQALTDLTFAGFSIPNGSKLFWSPNSTHKDPIYFPEPNKFDPSRFQGKKIVPYTYVPFGGGPRMCPGIEYARLEILVLMHNMVKTFRWEKMIPDEKIIVDPVPRLEKGLPIRLYPH